MTYFDTTMLDTTQLDNARKITSNQDKNVYSLFANYYEDTIIGFTASEIFRAFDKRPQKMLLTSVRRSINSLYKAGLLHKTNIKRNGMYGRPEVVWRLKIKSEQLTLL